MSASASSWNCPLPPPTLGGQVEPVLESVPVSCCQQPVSQQPVGLATFTPDSKPERNSRLPLPPPPEAGALATTRAWLILKYCWSETIFSTCGPAVSATPFLPTHWNAFQSA